jgi:hypothetical protein
MQYKQEYLILHTVESTSCAKAAGSEHDPLIVQIFICLQKMKSSRPSLASRRQHKARPAFSDQESVYKHDGNRVHSEAVNIEVMFVDTDTSTIALCDTLC